MTNAIRPQDEPLLHQLQHARHELAGTRPDVLAKQVPPPAFAQDMLKVLDAVAQSALSSAEASKALRVTLLGKRVEEWGEAELDQLLARIDEALVELVKPS